MKNNIFSNKIESEICLNALLNKHRTKILTSKKNFPPTYEWNVMNAHLLKCMYGAGAESEKLFTFHNHAYPHTLRMHFLFLLQTHEKSITHISHKFMSIHALTRVRERERGEEDVDKRRRRHV